MRILNDFGERERKLSRKTDEAENRVFPGDCGGKGGGREKCLASSRANFCFCCKTREKRRVVVRKMFIASLVRSAEPSAQRVEDGGNEAS